jgi:F0F1-type ATP synthase assembly protein I
MTEQPKKPNDRAYYLFAGKIVGDFTGTIAIPAVVFALIGEYLDTKYHKEPLFLMLGLLLAFSVSMKSVYKKTKKYSEEYQEIVKTDSTQK